MPVTSYNYTAVVDASRLEKEVHDDAAITTGLDYITTTETEVTVWMKAALSAPEETALDALVAAHVPTPLPDSPAHVLVDGPTGPSGELRMYSPPNRDNFYMCDRDFMVKTATVGANSFQDLRVNPVTLLESSWGELSQVGCYKLVDGAYVPCADQADADVNARLSIWDYWPKDGSNATIPLDFRGGRLFVDPTLTFINLTDYRLYAVMAPNIPAASGGCIPFFDGYLARADGGIIDSVNPTAVSISIDQSVEAVRLRLFIYYPAGAVTTHVLQLVTYRPLGSW